MSLAGPLPPSIASFPSLKVFTLQYAGFNLVPTEIGELTALRVFNGHGSGLAGN